MIKFLAQADSIDTLPTLSLYLIAFIRLLPIVTRFGSSISVLRSFNPSVQLLNNEIDKLKKYSKPDEKIIGIKKDTVKFEKNFELKQISFRYKDGHQNIFENFNHKIEKE